MKRTLLAFVKKHIGTRKKELLIWLLAWSMGLIMTTDTSSNSAMLVWGLISLVPLTLIGVIIASLFSPVHAKEREKEPLLIDVVRRPNDKTKWVVFLFSLFLLIPVIVFKYVDYKPELNRFFITAFNAFIVIFVVELVQLLNKRKVKS
jgi:hypothetical protein